MFELGLQVFRIFAILAIVNMNHVTAIQNGCGAFFERDVTYDGIIPNDEHLYIESITGHSIARCCLNCHRGLSSCVGLLYNREKAICKLLKRNLNETHRDHNATKDEWVYFLKVGSNGGCCADGWTPYNYHCYRYDDNILSWDDAEAVCEDQNSYLVQLETSEETAWVLTKVVDPFDNRTWVGATDRQVEGSFKWIFGHGGKISQSWYQGQPDNSYGGQDCLTVMRSGHFDDARCGDGKVFVCEMQQHI